MRIHFTTLDGREHEIDVDYGNVLYGSLEGWFADATGRLSVATLTGLVVAGRHIVTAWEVPAAHIEPNVVVTIKPNVERERERRLAAERRLDRVELALSAQIIEMLAQFPNVVAVEVRRHRRDAPWQVLVRRDLPVRVSAGVGSTLAEAAADALLLLDPEDGA